MEKILSDIIFELENKMKLPGSLVTTYTNILKVSEKIPKDAVVLMGGTSFKSLLSLTLALMTRGVEKKVCYLSSAVPEKQLLYYLMSLKTGISLAKLNAGKINLNEFSKVLKSFDSIISSKNRVIYKDEILLNSKMMDEIYSILNIKYDKLVFLEKKMDSIKNINKIVDNLYSSIEKIITAKLPQQQVYINICSKKNLVAELVNIKALHNRNIKVILNLNKHFLGFIKKYVTNFYDNILIDELTPSDKISNTYLYTDLENLYKIINFE